MKTIKTSYSFIAYADSRPGGRVENQDTYSSADTPHGLLLTVCDGMGGGPSGQLASSMAAESIIRFLLDADDAGAANRCDLLEKAVEYANSVVYEKSLENPANRGMGTTVTALLINDVSAVIAHVGDSRVYQFRQGKKIFRTWDHSLVFEKLRTGILRDEEEARLSSESNIILRALGLKEEISVDVIELSYEKGDRFLLCTDGIWGMFPEKDLLQMAARTKVLSGALESLIINVDEAGNRSGNHHDNLTAMLLETKKDSTLKDMMSTKQKRAVIALAVICMVSILLNIGLIVRSGKDKKEMKVGQDTEQVNKEEVQEAIRASERKLLHRMDSLVTARSDLKNVLSGLYAEEEIKSKLDVIISELQNLREMPAGDKKKEQLESVREELADIKTTEMADLRFEKDIDWAISELDKPIANQKDDEKGRSKGHYSIIINRLIDLCKQM